MFSEVNLFRNLVQKRSCKAKASGSALMMRIDCQCENISGLVWYFN